MKSSSLFDSNSLLANNENRRRSQSLDARSPGGNTKHSAYTPFGQVPMSQSLPYSGFSPPNTDFLFPSTGKSVDFAQSISPKQQFQFPSSHDPNFTRHRANTVDVLPSHNLSSTFSPAKKSTTSSYGKSSTADNSQMEDLIFAMEESDLNETKSPQTMSPSQDRARGTNTTTRSSSYNSSGLKSHSLVGSFGSEKVYYGTSPSSLSQQHQDDSQHYMHTYNSPFGSPQQGSSLPSSLSGSFSAHSAFGGSGGLGSPSFGGGRPSTPSSLHSNGGSAKSTSASHQYSVGGSHRAGAPPAIQTQPTRSSWADISSPYNQQHAPLAIPTSQTKSQRSSDSSSPSGNQSGVVREHPAGEYPSRTLFVRNISSGVDDEELKQLFSQYGEVRNIYTNCKQRGFVMISYYDIRHAKLAMKHLQHHPVKRRQIDIHYSIPKDNPSDKDVNQGTLVIFNLDPEVSNEELLTEFGKHGEIKEVRETPNKKHHKFIEFYDVRDAEKAMLALNKTDIHGKTIKIEPSRPGGRPKHHLQAPSSNPSSLPNTPLSSTDSQYPTWPDPGAFVPDLSHHPGPMMYGVQSPLTPHRGGPFTPNGGSPSMFHAPMISPSYQHSGSVPYGGLNPPHVEPSLSATSNYGPSNSFHSTPSTPGPVGFSAPGTPHTFSPISAPPQQVFPSGGPSSPPKSAASPTVSVPNARSRSSHNSSGDSGSSGGSTSRSKGSGNEKFKINMDKVRRGDDKRTTLMIKNIPNKYSQKMLLSEIDKKFKEKYDFFYLPIDFRNRCNVGYAFINLVNPSVIIPFSREFNKKKWGKFNSEKVCQLNYGRIQGKKNLVSHFENSSLMGEVVDCRPVFFDMEKEVYERDYSNC
uniref:RRM domain-containing protein n=1 Tax=Percolomonas cosmopolitus TaxID=63605 RepID=A0A7S1KLC6_9EUKA|mmetsp:Transcript_10745/g.40209  ORF Transcript_10745/g.40209 Transcript_10745/m.40209 type:complete len:858 (+) Transcript_10745:1741-4314(+)|eukprot:CAMPEP_0117434550 /NCGR_PEP_ID=MMETSP0759-20121206/11_1 /TAXON_ID=63605 /ORGANISM="Percolomonas cosmopolitus, Strain WS" /LENGTH=857 /DNA_ID=CAMNT_0005226045 /DNA_START=1671 /DNA_END=4244 /DNA_ORIENTATION=-